MTGSVVAAPKLPPGGLVSTLRPLDVSTAATDVPAVSPATMPRLAEAASTTGELQVLLPAGSRMRSTDVPCW